MNLHEVYKFGEIMEFDKWVKEIPYLQFPGEWKIRIIPPFSGAVIRFIAEYKEATVSVYLDCYDNLGFVGAPYWEIYPYEGDTFRCLMNETDLLISAIKKSFNDRII